jgi:hypothetical protein
MSQNAAFSSPEYRLVLVNSAAPGNSDGPSLAEISTEGRAEGALAYVAKLNAFYRLRPLSTATVDVTSGYNNVVQASNGGRWVRTNQLADVVLSGGTATIVNKFDMSGGGTFFTQGITNAGSPGVRIGAKTSATTATITSSSNTDTSTVKVEYVETLTA